MKKFLISTMFLITFIFSISFAAANYWKGGDDSPYYTYHHGYHWQAPHYMQHHMMYVPPGYLSNCFCCHEDYNKTKDKIIKRRWQEGRSYNNRMLKRR